MRIRTYLFNSFLVHALLLIYLFSLPLHRPTFQFGSYRAHFVYLKSERDITTRIPSPTHDAKKYKPQVRVKKIKIASKEIDVQKNANVPKAKKEILSPKEPEVIAKEIPEEKPAQVAEVKKTPIEETPAEKRKEEEVAKQETVETAREKPVQIAKVTEESETEKKVEPKKEEVLQETMAPAPDVMETKEPAKIEEPVREIPLDEKPEADVSATKESSSPTEKPPAEEKVSSPEVKKSTGLNETENVPREKGTFEEAKEKTLRAVTDKEIVPSKNGLKEETVPGKAKEGLEGQGLTSEQTKAPLLHEGHVPGQDEGKQQPIIQAKQEGEEKMIVEEKGPGTGIPVSEVLVPVDLKIEVVLRKPSSIHSDPQTQIVTMPPTISKQENMPKATEITNITLEESDNAVKVQIKGNGSMTPNVFGLNQNRIVIDIPKVNLNMAFPSVVSPLTNIRSGKHKNKSRLVLDLNKQMPFDVSSSGDTFVVTILKSDNKLHPPPVEQKAPEIIEVKQLKETDISNISMRLLKNVHPMANRKEKQTEVSLLEGKGEGHTGDASAVKKTFAVLRTAEGAYTFAIQNQEKETFAADLTFHIFPGKKGERTKKFVAEKLSPHTIVRFKFILPEGIFWDDEEYFSGKIENSETMTKFSEKTGLVWKEIKDE
jgi:hypothetical protein